MQKGLVEKLDLSQYLPFGDFVPTLISEEERLVDVRMRSALEVLQQRGVHLEYDGSKSSGVHIVSKTGAILGHVVVFCHPGWKQELLEDLWKLGNNPEKYGI